MTFYDEFHNLVDRKGSKQEFITLYKKHFEKEPSKEEIKQFTERVETMRYVDDDEDDDSYDVSYEESYYGDDDEDF